MSGISDKTDCVLLSRLSAQFNNCQHFMSPLKPTCGHFGEIIVSGCTGNRFLQHSVHSVAEILSKYSLSVHYRDVIMGAMASQITSLTIVYSTFYSGADQRKHQSSTSLAFVRGIHRRPVNFPHKCSVTWNMFPFDDVIMFSAYHTICYNLGNIHCILFGIKKSLC